MQTHLPASTPTPVETLHNETKEGIMMSEYGSFQGKPIDDQYLSELQAEATQGYDVDRIIKRRGGRPPLADGQTVVVPVRLTPSQVAALNHRIAASGKTRSEILREAVDAYLVPA